MQVSFVNKYTVSREDHSPFFMSPARHAERRRPVSAAPARGEGLRKWNGAFRWIGLLLAAIIIVMAFMSKMWMMVVIGALLVAMYVTRIYSMAQRDKARARNAVPPPSPEYSPTGKWTRYVRFGEHIEREDPDDKREYRYGQITRISDDPAYITLWMEDETQVRVLKKGFIVGTLDGFKQFIMTETGRLIGPGKEERTSETQT